jgi:hypothetical protein
MSKEEVHNALKASREINTFSDSRLWREAFDLYHQNTGVRVWAKDNCSKCFNKVKDWLEK